MRLAVLVLLSGGAGLAYEVLWARDWALLYGSTATGVAVVLAAYFAGMAAGSGLAGRAAPPRDLRRYAALEAGLALAALGYLAGRPLLPGISVGLAYAVPNPLLPVARALLALVVLAIPTMLLGATLPAVTATVTGSAAAGRLYAWNAAGGALGAVLCGSLAIRALGVRGTFLAAAGIDAVVAAAALVLVRRRVPTPASDAPRAREAIASRALVVAAVTGAIGLAAEVLWTRGLAGVLSSSVYSITIVLAAVLVGIALGAALAARPTRTPGPRLAVTQALLAMALLASLLTLHALPAVSLALARTWHVTGAGAGFAVEVVLALLVVLPAATLLGAAFPLVLAVARADAPGAAMGAVLAANTAGGIAGALGGAFVLLPRLGLGGGLVTLAVGAAVTGLALARGRGPRLVAGGAALVVAVTVVAAPALPLPWRGAAPDDRVLFYRDGATATVTVVADARGHKRLRVNGQYSLGGTDGVLLESREAHLPLLLHSAPRTLLALGVGTGDTAGAAALHPGLNVEGVELVAEVLPAAALFATENRGLLARPNAHLVVDDARSHLLASVAQYDVILSDLFLPWTAGTAALYSLDFYRLGGLRLAPGGLYCQWLPLHQLAVSDLASIVATFTAAFPHVQLWVAHHRTRTPLAALVGTREPLVADAATIRDRLHDPTLAEATAAAGLDDPDDLAALYVTDGPHLRTATAGAPLITDDRPGLEFTAPAAYFHQDGLARAALAWTAARLDPAPAPVAGTDATFALRAALLSAELALLDGDGPAELRAYLSALDASPRSRSVRRALGAIARERQAAGDRETALGIAAALARTPGAAE